MRGDSSAHRDNSAEVAGWRVTVRREDGSIGIRRWLAYDDAISTVAYAMKRPFREISILAEASPPLPANEP